MAKKDKNKDVESKQEKKARQQIKKDYRQKTGGQRKK